MGAYFIRRLLLFFPTLLLVSLMVFFVLRIVPGDPALTILLGQSLEGNFTEEQLLAKQKQLGTDRAMVVQYWKWISGIPRGDFGKSYIYQHITVVDEIKQRFPVTIELAIMAIIMSFILAIPVGVIGAVAIDSWADYTGKIITITGVALPTFWVAILMVYGLARFFDWLPPLFYQQIWESPWTNLKQLFFPALALCLQNAAFQARVTRSSMLEVLQEDYIRTARAKGLSERVVLFRHALKSAFLPVITVSGWQFSRLLGGAILVEIIFVVPGTGALLVDAISVRDYNIIQAVVLLAAVVVLTINLMVDMLYGWLNPRVRYA
jgi:peptide/nickel transport system permease protein